MNSDSEIGIGFSDRILLGVSIVGFTALVYVVHSLLSGLRNGTGSSNDDQEADGLTDEERLIRCADVNSLNRTQRRVRAKAIMKEQRRLHHPSAELVDDNNENGVVGNVDPMVEEHRLPQPVLSRKERQQQAKVAEKEERRLFQDERERQQKLVQLEAQRQKKERLIAATQRLLEEEQKKAIEEAAREERERDLWYTFIMTTTPNGTTVKKSVAEFVQACQKNRVVDIQMLATQYDVEPSYISDRIKHLIADGRIAGFFQSSNHEQQYFIFLSDDELHAIASATRKQGCVSIQQFATICQQVIKQ